ncbi:hypothetical protein COW36_06015 [bacterium (Candidatus Blackallbacteria) CG17_big_fil_post_rev_8_21_14_2_50_48_46]|uniref:Uncharacterized protein n=1 Tax=bacterium (Candidatus Blackallbacteria) CG17_big_fil_post_rev_8_21_14_2_50_48_46 TaxID=2014261 RepID=A0A2M7G7N2_9BACT|nr:MAG: hypothetical protein COW64_16845 [bacterium (Candidatus Blackallbacteria) CG18_big_fil_WC_8_21_14_2_50_49_26]PIW18084.1 MAG: hypothetical protein COW36_06015 [bacterium (Candidatus Blackallbacteria) CG17_big_fil_post_rev_8_21_14_2_50_48_46]PIW51093.1 MAG: hypothetical protein COW20_00165 [bacterium (Candidatus Blackallbacteria) CG13_big_fil_rev_8_21_14_2_50_49_14]
MLDFQALASARQEVGVRDEERQRRSAELYQKALLILADFQRKQGIQKSLLKQAANLLHESLLLNNQNPYAYLCMSYIFFVLNDLPRTRRYLNAARKLSPHLPEAGLLQKCLAS